MKPSIAIRRAEAMDAPALATLCRQLGDEVTASQVLAHLERHRTEASQCLLVALLDTAVVGWLEAGVRHAVQDGRGWAEVSGLVVEASQRGYGVGSALLAAARSWAVGQGMKRLRVRTRVERTEAARFYEKNGFRLKKQQRVYDVDL